MILFICLNKFLLFFIAFGMDRSAIIINDHLAQRWIVYLSSAVHLRFQRLDWFSGQLSSVQSNRNPWKNVVDQADLSMLQLCDTYHQLIPLTEQAYWIDGLQNSLKNNAVSKIADQFITFQDAGFSKDILGLISTEILYMLDVWLSKLTEEHMTEEIIGSLSSLCSELVCYPKSAEYFLNATQLLNVEEIKDRLEPSSGLEFLFTSAYQLFPLIPMPITKLFASCAHAGNESAAVVRNLFQNMACFTVQIRIVLFFFDSFAV